MAKLSTDERCRAKQARYCRNHGIPFNFWVKEAQRHELAFQRHKDEKDEATARATSNASYVEAKRHQKLKTEEEAKRRDRIAAKVAMKNTKKEADARAAADQEAAVRKEAKCVEVLCRQILSDVKIPR